MPGPLLGAGPHKDHQQNQVVGIGGGETGHHQDHEAPDVKGSHGENYTAASPGATALKALNHRAYLPAQGTQYVGIGRVGNR